MHSDSFVSQGSRHSASLLLERSPGCQYVGSLPTVLQHYEEECAFHAVKCPRCGESVLHAALATLCLTRCCDTASFVATTDNPHSGDDRVFRAGDVSAALEALKALRSEPHQNQQPAMESQVNRLTEYVTNHGVLLLEIMETLRVTSVNSSDCFTRS